MKGIKNRICRKKVIRMDGFGFPIDWKKVVASITNPRIGVMQKLILNPEAPIFSISSDAPKASRIALGKNKTANQIMQVMPTEKAAA